MALQRQQQQANGTAAAAPATSASSGQFPLVVQGLLRATLDHNKFVQASACSAVAELSQTAGHEDAAHVLMPHLTVSAPSDHPTNCVCVEPWLFVVHETSSLQCQTPVPCKSPATQALPSHRISRWRFTTGRTISCASVTLGVGHCRAHAPPPDDPSTRPFVSIAVVIQSKRVCQLSSC
jgi:hypothetical protein